MIWLRRALPFLGVLIVLGLIYDAWIFYSRATRDREVKQAQVDRQAELARNTAQAFGGLDLKILNFYAAQIPGRPVNLCYGVTGAKTVRIEPPLDGVWPALTRCIQVSPKKDTEYRLIAEDKSGHSVSQSVLVKARP